MKYSRNNNLNFVFINGTICKLLFHQPDWLPAVLSHPRRLKAAAVVKMTKTYLKDVIVRTLCKNVYCVTLLNIFKIQYLIILM